MSTVRTIAVLGGGSAGFTAARAAARAGARVVWFLGDDPDRASLCVNRGCMPSKALFGPIDALHHARRLGLARVEALRPEALLGQIVARKDREIARFRAWRRRAIADRAGPDFRVVRGAARFVDSHVLASGSERHTIDAVVLATGSRPDRPPIPGLDRLRGVWGSDELLSNTRLPDSLVVVGAGAIGLEFSLRYARLGARVTLVARTRPLSEYPQEFGLRLAQIYEREGVRVLTDAAIGAVRRDVEGWYVVETEGPDGFEPVTGERLAVVTGRRPALATVGLAAACIEPGPDGRLTVGNDMRVAGAPHVFAAGDVIGRRLVVHQAHIEAGIAAANAVDDGARTWDRRADLQVVYSDPEFAYAGLTPIRAAERGHALVTGRKQSRLVGKLHLAGDDHGFGAFVADADDHRLLGAGLLCQGAADMIHLPAYMIDHGHTVHQGAAAEYYHPARIEIVSGILDDLCSRLDGTPPRRADTQSG